MIESFEKKPEKSGTPQIASQQTRKTPWVQGIRLRRPPMLGDVARAAHGVHHRAGAEEEAGLEEGVGEEVEDAGVEVAPVPTPANMKPSWLTVE